MIYKTDRYHERFACMKIYQTELCFSSLLIINFLFYFFFYSMGAIIIQIDIEKHYEMKNLDFQMLKTDNLWISNYIHVII